MDVLETLNLTEFEAPFSQEIKEKAILALESGKVLYFPELAFRLSDSEKSFLSPDIVDPKSKNISYDLRKDLLKGTLAQGEEAAALKAMMKRFATNAKDLVSELFPYYQTNLSQARTSFRPVEVLGRVSSYRKDDTRLHVDAFPSAPVKGRRILRVFSNVNPDGKPRVWRIGEPFSCVAQHFIPKISGPLPGISMLMKFLGITKDYRTLYDHYMLKMHDMMKGDTRYQKEVTQKEVKFPPGSTWIVYSDQVSHAAMSGQHLFEQTFYLPPYAMQNAETTPLHILERLLQRNLV
jgi:hypothetical protein